MDVLPNIGVSIHGLQATATPPTRTPDVAELPSKSVTLGDLDPEDAPYHAKMMQAIQPAIDRNQQLDPMHKCSLPYATVDLDLIDGTDPRYCHQYKIPTKKAEFLRKQINTWLHSGVIRQVNQQPGTPCWNNPMIVPTRVMDDGSTLPNIQL